MPPLVVWLSAGSVNGMPTIRQPWCSSGRCIDSKVDSWPPCIEAVEVNTPAGLPARVPLAHSAPRPSRKCFIGAAMLPKRVGLPSSKPLHSARSALSTYGAPSSGTGGALVWVTAATGGTVRSRAPMPGTSPMPRAICRASRATEPPRL